MYRTVAISLSRSSYTYICVCLCVSVETTPLLRKRGPAKVMQRHTNTAQCTHTHTHCSKDHSSTKCAGTTPLRFWSLLRKTRHGVDDTDVLFRNTLTYINIYIHYSTRKFNASTGRPWNEICHHHLHHRGTFREVWVRRQRSLQLLAHCTLKPISVRTLRENVSNTNTAICVGVWVPYTIVPPPHAINTRPGTRLNVLVGREVCKWNTR